jgi:hypothetical protein
VYEHAPVRGAGADGGEAGTAGVSPKAVIDQLNRHLLLKLLVMTILCYIDRRAAAVVGHAL